MWGGGEAGEVSANEYICAHGAQINFGYLTPFNLCAGPMGRLSDLAGDVNCCTKGISFSQNYINRH